MIQKRRILSKGNFNGDHAGEAGWMKNASAVFQRAKSFSAKFLLVGKYRTRMLKRCCPFMILSGFSICACERKGRTI
jgi:hypothetical protein